MVCIWAFKRHISLEKEGHRYGYASIIASKWQAREFFENKNTVCPDSGAFVFGGFVFECKVIDSSVKQFVKLDYDVVFHHFYPQQFRTFRHYLDKTNQARKQSPEFYNEQLTIDDEQFATWYKHALSSEGMSEARAEYEQKKPDLTDSLTLIPSAIEG